MELVTPNSSLSQEKRFTQESRFEALSLSTAETYLEHVLTRSNAYLTFYTCLGLSFERVQVVFKSAEQSVLSRAHFWFIANVCPFKPSPLMRRIREVIYAANLEKRSASVDRRKPSFPSS